MCQQAVAERLPSPFSPVAMTCFVIIRQFSDSRIILALSGRFGKKRFAKRKCRNRFPDRLYRTVRNDLHRRHALTKKADAGTNKNAAASAFFLFRIPVRAGRCLLRYRSG